MRKLILKWLFGTDKVDEYFDLLCKFRDEIEEHRDEMKDHVKTIEGHIDTIKSTKKLIQICKNHGIDIDEEIKRI